MYSFEDLRMRHVQKHVKSDNQQPNDSKEQLKHRPTTCPICHYILIDYHGCLCYQAVILRFA